MSKYSSVEEWETEAKHLLNERDNSDYHYFSISNLNCLRLGFRL